MQLDLNAFQRKVLDTYANGELSHITTKQELDECGDGLLRFLLVELSSGEDCGDAETACQRVETAISDLSNVLQHLQDLALCTPGALAATALLANPGGTLQCIEGDVPARRGECNASA